MATTLATTPHADRAAPGGYVAQPHSLQERLRWLELDAASILRAPDRHRADEVAWANDMLRAGGTEERR